MLAPVLDGATVLDLYCGTGTLGLEALSQGAGRCCFADRDRAAIARLRRNIEMVAAADRCEVRCGEVESHLERWLDELGWRVDVAFVDPPYAQTRRWSWAEAADKIFAPLGRRLAEGGVVVLRMSGPEAPPQRVGPLVVRRIRRYGEMVLALMGKAGPA